MIKTEFLQLSEDLLLSDEDQIIFRLRYVDKMTSLDIANALNRKENYINKKLFILRQKLSKHPIFNKKAFNVDIATEIELKDRCRHLSYSSEKTQFCVDAFVYKLSNKNLAEKYNYTLETVKKYKTLRRKELNK